MIQLPELKLPAFDCKIKETEAGTMIWDLVRKKYVMLTPEEWVRQHFVSLLIEHLKYPATLFKIESGVQYNKRHKRTDIEILDRSEVQLDETTIRQLTIYNQTIQAKYLALTNGLKHFFWGKHETGEGYTQLAACPEFQ
jgi:hypothetical protein